MRTFHKNIRIPGYDYSSPGTYFITLVTVNRECLLSRVVDGRLQLSRYGCMVEEGWRWLAGNYIYVKCEELVVMPNHIHGVLVIQGEATVAQDQAVKRLPLGRLVAAFKNHHYTGNQPSPGHGQAGGLAA